ncbi:MAG: LysE family translocator [Pseudomonadota bacterium]
MPAVASPDVLVALFLFAFAASVTPGPNNVMLASSGATFGLRRTVPHILGIIVGFPLMVFSITLGLGEVFRTQPALQKAIAWIGFVVMMWLAWRIARQHATASKGASEPLGFLGAALFQWVNPKAWVACIAVAATYATGAAPLAEAIIIALVFVVAGSLSCTTWAGFGAALGRFLGDGWRLSAFNGTMGALLALSALWLVIGG